MSFRRFGNDTKTAERMTTGTSLAEQSCPFVSVPARDLPLQSGKKLLSGCCLTNFRFTNFQNSPSAGDLLPGKRNEVGRDAQLLI